MTVLRCIEKSPKGNRWRFVISVTDAMIKTVDMNGFVFCYRRSDGLLKVSPYSCNIVDNHILIPLDKIETFCMKNGVCNTVFGKPVWDGGLRPYLKSDNTINPQWRNKDTGASVTVTGIRRIAIKKLTRSL